MIDDLIEAGTDPEAEPAPAVPAAPAAPAGVTVGALVGFGPGGEPWVDHPDNPDRRPLPARTTVELAPAQVGSEVAIAFEAADPRRPVVLGVLRPAAPPRPLAEVDGERLVLEAGREIVLRCGEASLTLTRAGKVLLRGTYVLSRSSGVHRILGGAVRIN
jgi:hypothetical protein